LKWWTKRKETDHAWKVTATEILQQANESNSVSCNLDIRNPNTAETLEHLPPQQLVNSIIARESEVVSIMEEIKALLESAQQ